MVLGEREHAPFGRPGSPHWLRRHAVPIIVIALVGVITADVAVLGELSRRRSALEAAEAEPYTPGLGPGARPVSNDNDYVVKPAPLQSPGASPQAAAPRPQVQPLKSTHAPHLFAVTRKPLTEATLKKVAKVAGIRAMELADAAEVTIDGKRVQTLGVDPSTFRAYTPRPTAKSDALWGNIAGGDVAVSFVLGNDGGLRLGTSVNAANRTLRIGAYATMGMGSIDAVVSRTTARDLGIPQNNALVISAPKQDSVQLRKAVMRALPKGSQVATINPVLKRPNGTVQPQGRTTWPVGALMSVPQIETALRAAASKLGRPYVWGAEGPETFDCSGLVQWAYGQAGVRMPRVTHQQWVTGPRVSLAQAQPGDLLFWRHDPTNPGYISHVAIYWGKGKMLHAPRTGDVVKIAPISTRNLAGVVRISPQVAAHAR
ncbi:C40 family peptidase [Spongiactinospora rosea]|uniref:C40 family peptidase n=1 Tax=Spongiactinospora rosea TaxID=2248750 RepID=UPI001CEDB56B|nr:C40 family peptidase [Spongiactinospora rosea]